MRPRRAQEAWAAPVDGLVVMLPAFGTSGAGWAREPNPADAITCADAPVSRDGIGWAVQAGHFGTLARGRRIFSPRAQHTRSRATHILIFARTTCTAYSAVWSCVAQVAGTIDAVLAAEPGSRV